jgi:hypothetical protein
MMFLLPFFTAAFVMLEILLIIAAAFLCVFLALCLVATIVRVEVERERIVRRCERRTIPKTFRLTKEQIIELHRGNPIHLPRKYT